MKKNILQIIISLTLTAVLFLSVAEVASADGQNCVGNYGEQISCGTTHEDFHPPVNAGLGDINFGVVGGVILAASTVVFVYSKKAASIASK